MVLLFPHDSLIFFTKLKSGEKPQNVLWGLIWIWKAIILRFVSGTKGTAVNLGGTSPRLAKLSKRLSRTPCIPLLISPQWAGTFPSLPWTCLTSGLATAAACVWTTWARKCWWRALPADLQDKNGLWGPPPQKLCVKKTANVCLTYVPKPTFNCTKLDSICPKKFFFICRYF